MTSRLAADLLELFSTIARAAKHAGNAELAAAADSRAGDCLMAQIDITPGPAREDSPWAK